MRSNPTNSKPWQGLSTSLEAILRRLGVRLGEEELPIFGNLQDLDLRCHTVSTLIEDLVSGRGERGAEETGAHVGRLVGEVKALTSCALAVKPQLESLVRELHSAKPSSAGRTKHR